MSLHRLHPLVYLAVAVVVYAVGDLGGIGADPVVSVVTVADGGVTVHLSAACAATPADPGAVSPPVRIQIDAPQATGGARAIGAGCGDFGLLHGLTADVGSFGGTGKQQDEVEHGRGVA